MSKITLEPGTYWIGDLCYVIENETWQNKICTALNHSEEHHDGTDPALVVLPGGCAFLGNTSYGDGTYTGSNGFNYGVDSGTIGIVNKEAMNKVLTDCDTTLGTFITRDKHFSVSIENGTFKFDDIIIETDDNDDCCEECGVPECCGCDGRDFM
jgi:hypothetical protein